VLSFILLGIQKHNDIIRATYRYMHKHMENIVPTAVNSLQIFLKQIQLIVQGICSLDLLATI